MEQTVYLIRHKATGQFMPLVERNRGYTHWNPGQPNKMYAVSTGVPRILASERKAKNVIAQWACNPNGKERWFDGEPEFDIKPDGRTKDDLEVVPCMIVDMERLDALVFERKMLDAYGPRE